MKKIQYLFWLLVATSCGSSDKTDKKLSEFSFPPSHKIERLSSFAMSYIEADTLLVGETFRTKIFLANRHNLYESGNIEPIIKFQFDDKFTGWENLIYNAKPIKVINDTAYVKFNLKDEGLKRGESKLKKWYASITIPLQSNDTSFVLEQDFVLLNK